MDDKYLMHCVNIVILKGISLKKIIDILDSTTENYHYLIWVSIPKYHHHHWSIPIYHHNHWTIPKYLHHHYPSIYNIISTLPTNITTQNSPQLSSSSSSSSSSSLADPIKPTSLDDTSSKTSRFRLMIGLKLWRRGG